MRMRVQRTCKSVMMMHRSFSQFEEFWRSFDEQEKSLEEFGRLLF